MLNTLVKNVIRRPRPVAKAIDHAPSTYSMPSAHTSMAMVGAATMQVIVPDLAVLWWVVAISLAASRVLLGMHYLADVLAGVVFGLLVGLLVAAPLVESISATW
ncbi:MAG: phosphatase PAP2 family protein [Thermoleophilia bacterium]|nr:phosphatase PAP2 family protein [Thermoleophilia bacterium]